MSQSTMVMDVPAAVAVGEAKPVRDLREKWVQVAGTFSATFALEVSLDGGNNYLAVTSNITAAGLHQIPHPATHLRVRVTGFVSGAPLVVVAGYND